jgi:uncharacterized lipoprotein YmbA
MSQPFPDKDFFALEPGRPQSPAAQPIAEVLRVRGLRVSEPFDGVMFVYKTGPAKYKTDYYNGFIASPEQLLSSELVRWLSESHAFIAVLDSAGEGNSRYLLDGVVTELYGDYTNPVSPKAVMAAKFLLLDDSGASTLVISQKTYRKEAPLEAKTPTALAAGLGAAFRQILIDLTADFGQVPPAPVKQAVKR